jgi:four helix bundle protein
MTNKSPIDNVQNSKQYDLEERTLQFSKKVAFFIKKLPKSISNIEYGRQVIRSSGSVGSNYIEANEALGKKDFMMRIRICLKEAKESSYWLRLIVETNEELFADEGVQLFKEATELKKIFLLSW